MFEALKMQASAALKRIEAKECKTDDSIIKLIKNSGDSDRVKTVVDPI